MLLSRVSLPLVVMFFLPVASRAADKVDFSRDIRPILSNHCFKCHGPATQKAKLRFDGRDHVTKSGAIVPGKPADSDMLKRIAASPAENVLEVGCGQGTDGVTLCGLLRPGARYTGVDMSEVSLTSARAAAREAAAGLAVEPHFQMENAERLSFADGTFDCVLSVGALHHSADTEQALAEVRRVLAPGGTVVVLLYRRWSLKLLVSHALRGVPGYGESLSSAVAHFGSRNAAAKKRTGEAEQAVVSKER